MRDSSRGGRRSVDAEDDLEFTPGRLVGAAALVSAAVFLALSLASYTPDDPSLNHYASGDVRNWMGIVGAHLAGFLRDMLGHAAWITSAWFLYGAFRLINPARPAKGPGFVVYTGWLLITVSATMILTLMSNWIHSDFMFRAGGLAGIFLVDFFTSWTGTGGSVLFSLLMLFAGLVTAVPSFPKLCIRGFSCLAGPGRRKQGGEDTEEPEGKGPAGKAVADDSGGSAGRTGRRKSSASGRLAGSGADEQQNEPKITAPARPGTVDSAGKDISQPADAPGGNGDNIKKDFEIKPLKGEFRLPPLSFLKDVPPQEVKIDRDVYLENARILEQKLLDFSVAGKVVEICPGPVVTMYEFSPAPGVKINKVASLADDLALALKTHSVRIVAPIPGKAVIGIELANATRQGVWLKEILGSDIFLNNNGKLLLALGHDIVGQPVVTDLARMPHLLIAGATGTGKSVGLNAMICSLLYRLGPDALRLLMIDPKRIELSLYDGIPHLIHPVVSEPKEATRALKWAVMEMERRYHLLEEAHARNLEGYNSKAEEKLPYLVVIIDELADLMMVSSKEVEAAIARLAQMARAAGIHLLIATQRPSVDVLTGLIKANFPARLSFKVSSKVDSRTILDVMGAERLLGMGDMLFLPPGSSAPERIHGAYVSENEIIKVVEFLKAQGEPDYDPAVTEAVPGDAGEGGSGGGEFEDEKYDEAVEIVTSTGLASISGLQRRLRIGYNRAARMIEQMERDGVVTPTDSMGRRQVIARSYEDD